jgi:CRP/FNR family transcriptional regulator, cyclic AMP receptor protein
VNTGTGPKRSLESKRRYVFDFAGFLKTINKGVLVSDYSINDLIFSQGHPCNEVCYLERGKVKISVLSKQGKEAVIAIVERGQFFGEDCLIGRTAHMSTATTLTETRVVRFEEKTIERLLQENRAFLSFFASCLLARTIRVQEDLLNHLFNGSEKRLARILLVLAHLTNRTKATRTAVIVPKISQETLAAMVGTTRPRVNYFMKKFRKSGYIDYDGGLRVHRSLAAVLGD